MKQKILWYIGLIVALLTAAIGYCSCSETNRYSVEIHNADSMSSEFYASSVDECRQIACKFNNSKVIIKEYQSPVSWRPIESYYIYYSRK